MHSHQPISHHQIDLTSLSGLKEVILHLPDISNDILKKNNDLHITHALESLLQLIHDNKNNLEENSLLNKKKIEFLSFIENLPRSLKENIKLKLPEALRVYFDFEVNTSMILKYLADHFHELFPNYTPKSSTKNHIKKLIAISNEHYSEEYFYGRDELNTQFLLDKTVCDLLDQDTLKAILYYKTKEDNRICVDRFLDRESETISSTNLAEILLYGFQSKQLLEFVNPNFETYGFASYNNQQALYNEHTRKILQNISKLTKYINTEKLYQDPHILFIPDIRENLAQRLLVIKDTITKICNDKALSISDFLAIKSKQSAFDLFEQINFGLQSIAKFLGYQTSLNKNPIRFFTKDSLPIIIKKFLQNNEILLHGEIMHYFYDKIHLIAGLVSDTKILIGTTQYKFSDVFEEIIKQCDQLPIDHLARKQFSCRLFQIENYFKENSLFTLNFYHSNEIQKNTLKIFSALKYGHIEIVKDLIAKKDCDFNAIFKDEYNRETTLLNMAIACRHTDLVKRIINAGAKVNHNQLHPTPLELAIRVNKLEIINVLIDAGAEIIDFKEIIQWAEQHKQYNLISKIIDMIIRQYQQYKNELVDSLFHMIALESEEANQNNFKLLSVPNNYYLNLKHLHQLVSDISEDENLTSLDKFENIVYAIEHCYKSILQDNNGIKTTKLNKLSNVLKPFAFIEQKLNYDKEFLALHLKAHAKKMCV